MNDRRDGQYGENRREYPIFSRESLLLEYGPVNKAFLLNRGWTRTAIKRVLGEPDRRILMRNRPKDRPECRYDMTRVLAAEEAGPIRFRRAPERNREDANEANRRETERDCRYCGLSITYMRSAVGRPRKYCSDRCRNMAAKKSSGNRCKKPACDHKDCIEGEISKIRPAIQERRDKLPSRSLFRLRRRILARFWATSGHPWQRSAARANDGSVAGRRR
jgi:hypothetical protein